MKVWNDTFTDTNTGTYTDTYTNTDANADTNTNTDGGRVIIGKFPFKRVFSTAAVCVGKTTSKI